MMSRLKKSNKRLTLPLLGRGAPRLAGCGAGAFEARPASMSIRYRIPSSPMPRSASGEPGCGQPGSLDEAVLGEGIDGVLATGWHKATRRRAQRRRHVPVQLDQKDQPARGG